MFKRWLTALFIVLLCFITVQSYGACLTKKGILSWTAPTTNADGTPIRGLAGYKVYCGQKSSTYTVIKDVGNVLTYNTNSLLTDALWYCAITAYNIWNRESVYSSEVCFIKDTLAPEAPN